METIAMTTSNSMRVIPFRRVFHMEFIAVPSGILIFAFANYFTTNFALFRSAFIGSLLKFLSFTLRRANSLIR